MDRQKSVNSHRKDKNMYPLIRYPKISFVGIILFTVISILVKREILGASYDARGYIRYDIGLLFVGIMLHFFSTYAYKEFLRFYDLIDGKLCPQTSSLPQWFHEQTDTIFGHWNAYIVGILLAGISIGALYTTRLHFILRSQFVVLTMYVNGIILFMLAGIVVWIYVQLLLFVLRMNSLQIASPVLCFFDQEGEKLSFSFIKLAFGGILLYLLLVAGVMTSYPAFVLISLLVLWTGGGAVVLYGVVSQYAIHTVLMKFKRHNRGVVSEQLRSASSKEWTDNINQQPEWSRLANTFSNTFLVKFGVVCITSLLIVLTVSEIRKEVLSVVPFHIEVLAPLHTVKIIGNPFAKRYPKRVYPRNIWDMQSFAGRIYLGHGDTAFNTGPVDIIYFDPHTQQFMKEYTAPEEAILSYRVIDGELMLPGADPTESRDLGNFYRYSGGAWKKIRTIPEGLHCLDIVVYHKQFFAAINTPAITPELEAAVAQSDDGKTWIIHHLHGEYVFSLFEYDTRLFAATSEGKIYEYRDFGFHETLTDWFPSLQLHRSENERLAYLSVFRPTLFRNQLVYIGMRNFHIEGKSLGYDPVGFFRAKRLSPELFDIQPVPVPGKVYDVLVRGESCYLLTSSPEDDMRFMIRVFVTPNLCDFKTVAEFTADSFARSFEILDNRIYIGLGCDVYERERGAGGVLSLKLSSESIERL